MDKEHLLMLFVKNPVEGSVKTRLAQTLGDKKALDIYLKLIRITESVARRVEAARQIWYSDKIENGDLFTDELYEKHTQYGDDLGVRMRNAFEEGFKKAFTKIVIIGSDCPDISIEIIEKAFDELDVVDVVVGPSEDGGYYLLGMNKFIPELFDGISWSTPDVLDQTIKKVVSRGNTIKELAVLNDIDTEKDLNSSTLLNDG
jgi:uncharacterized protein